MVLVSSLLASAGAAGTKGKSRQRVERVEELAYQEPAIGSAFPPVETVYCVTGCLVFDVALGERYVSLEAFDSVTGDVALGVYPWNDATGDANRYDEHLYCTSMDEPLDRHF